MDSSNWRPAQPEPHREYSAGGGDWRFQLPPDSREQIVGMLVQALKRLLPFFGRDGLLEPETIAMNFEEKIYDASTSQSDYLREVSSKMLSLKMLSLKMLAVESNSDQPMPIAFGVSRNSLDLVPVMDSSNWRPAQPEPHREDSAGGGDWRFQLPPDSREQIVGMLVQTLKRLLPCFGQDGLLEPETIAMNFEKKIYDASISQSDYLQEASSKMLSLKMLSLKMLAMES